MKKFFLSAFLLILAQLPKAQSFSSSNLPIVIITTDSDPVTNLPLAILDEPRVLANIKIINHIDGSRNYVADQNDPFAVYFTGRISIEIRGSSSQDLPKKSYGLTTLQSDNVTALSIPLLGLPKENDWILNSLPFDPSLIRDYTTYTLAQRMGNYAPHGVYCELMLNGVYKGLYLFMEKLKIDDNRINISKMLPTDISGESLTGGYVTKCDKTTGGDPVAWSISPASFIHDSPDPAVITSQQNTYIYNQFIALKNLSAAKNASATNGYPSIIDVPSFVDFMIMNELSSNVDGYQYSTFFHKERNGKLRAGPIWDFNLTYGNDLFQYGFDRSKTSVWQFSDGGNDGAPFWKSLFAEPTYLCYLTKRWQEMNAAKQPLCYDSIARLIDVTVAKISEAAVRDNNLWKTSGAQSTNVANMKTWIQNRISWMNSKLTNCTACKNVAVPSLVITKIQYHPIATSLYPSDSLEFIELTNKGTTTINLTGVYFKNLGLTYQFPAGATLAASAKIVLASNAKSFLIHYGYKPYGQFTRNLSNFEEDLILVDAFGNLIDQVKYQGFDPWPIDANGLGACLSLKDINSDNNIAANWEAVSVAAGLSNVMDDAAVSIYPMPATKELTIYSATNELLSCEMFDLFGRLVLTRTGLNSNKCQLNIQHLAPNIYVLKLCFSNGSVVSKKIVKE